MAASKAEPLRIFVDADALLAGSASATGASHLILQLGELGLIRAVACQQVRREVARNLETKLPAALPAFGLLADAAIQWVDDPAPEELRPWLGLADPKDLPILVAAIRQRCAYLVTVNTRHYRPEAQAIRVEKPGDFLLHLREHLARLAE